MPSSISNSSLPRARTALLLAAALVTAIAILRTDRGFASAPSWYWRMKLEWRQAAATVLAGDSQVYRGLDPTAFAERLGQPCLNFGFSSAALDGPYLDAVERVLQPGPPRVVVLGVSAWSLTPRAATRNGFTEAAAEARHALLPTQLYRHGETFAQALRPFALDRLATAGPTRATAEDYLQEFKLNGWVASDHRRRHPESGLEVVRANHANGNRVDPNAVNRLATRVAAWRQQGIRVLAFVPPTPPDAAQLTAELAGWDPAAIAATLRAAGATWVDIDSRDYETYDGVHLTAESARKLSAALAARLP